MSEPAQQASDAARCAAPDHAPRRSSLPAPTTSDDSHADHHAQNDVNPSSSSRSHIMQSRAAVRG